MPPLLCTLTVRETSDAWADALLELAETRRELLNVVSRGLAWKRPD